MVDAIAGLRSHRYRNITLDSYHENDDFEILVPIYGDTKYLTNGENLAQYGDRVILCTTSGESETFYEELEAIADQYNFRIFVSDHSPAPTNGKRMTSGTIRDRIVRDALNVISSAHYTVCLDADTTTVLPLNMLVGELEQRGAELASVRLTPQESGPMLVQLQRFEYRLAMRLRFVIPWLVSGACHVGTTDALRTIMQKHSLFFQGNDVETGLLGEQLGFKVTHIPFEVPTDVPETFKSWWRQRLAWSGGEFRLFVANIRFAVHHPFFWMYGLVIVIALAGLRWASIVSTGWTLLVIAVLYFIMVYALHWRQRNRWLILMPFYGLVSSLILTPLGIIWYFVMAIPERNFGIIRPQRAID